MIIKIITKQSNGIHPIIQVNAVNIKEIDMNLLNKIIKIVDEMNEEEINNA
jgi:hypothetical protein